MKLMLHMCCAPCAVAIVEKLQSNTDILLEGYFYNPNIHPLQEYENRKLSVRALENEYGLPIIYQDENGMSLWKEKLGGDKSLRCTTCYSLRLDAAAKMAKENGFDAFTTSLLISPYQDHDLIKAVGEKMAQKYAVHFYYEDFRELYRKGREIARGKHFFMQKYCGCLYSYSESDHPKKPIYVIE